MTIGPTIDTRPIERCDRTVDPTELPRMEIAAVRFGFRAYRNPDGVWIAVSDPLGLTVEAESWSELFKAIDETMNLILRDVLKRGELEKYLMARGCGI